jgi:hypothetical protein
MANKVLQNFTKICAINKPRAILCRGNRGAMTELMEALKLNRKVHMAGDFTTMINEVEACVSLMEGRRLRPPEFQVFRDWNELVEHSETEVGAELATLFKRYSTFDRLRLCYPPSRLSITSGRKMQI